MEDSQISSTSKPREPISLLGLLSLLTIRPSSWSNLINNIDPDLNSTFTVLDLQRKHLEDTRVISILKNGYIAIPILSSLVIFLCLYPYKPPIENYLYGFVFGSTASLLISILGSLTTNVATGILIGLVGGISSGIAHGFEGGEGSVITTELTAISQQLFSAVPLNVDIGTGYWAVLLSSSIAAAEVINVARSRSEIEINRKVSSIIFGTVIGTLIFFLITFLISFVGPYSVSLIIGCLALIITRLQTKKWFLGIAIGIIIGILSFLGSSILFLELIEKIAHANLYASIAVKSIAHALIESIFFVVIFAAPYMITKKIADEVSGAIAGVLGSAGGYMGLAIASANYSLWPDAFLGMAVILTGLTVTWWLPVLLYPVLLIWDAIVYFLDRNLAVVPDKNLIELNSAFWIEIQYLPLLGLDNHLLLLLERDQEAGEKKLELLSLGTQRWAVRAAQMEFDVRDLEKRKDIEGVSDAHKKFRFQSIESLKAQSETILYSLSRISEDIDAALKQKSNYNKRLSLKYSSDRLGALLRELNRTNDRSAVRFTPVVVSWLAIVNNHISYLENLIDQNKEIVSPYIVGIPINQQQAIFVGRVGIAKRIEQLILHQTQSPPILLYGQRRMGKTSLINNFGKLLTSSIVPLFVDLQGPASSAKSDAGFLYVMSKSMAISAKNLRGLNLEHPSYADFAEDPFIIFNDWLDHLEERCSENIVLIALDEFEVLAQAFSANRLSEVNILGMLRNLIQHRSRFRLLLSGSNTLEKFQKWSNYLINSRTFKVGYLNKDESRQLIVSPVEDFELLYEPAAVDQIIELTRGHPYLIQLLCDEIIFLKNEQAYSQRFRVNTTDVEDASTSALQVGELFFEFIESQVNAPGLAFLRKLTQLSMPTINNTNAQPWELDRLNLDISDDVIRPLCELDIIERHEGFYRFQVELIRRWFYKKAHNN